MCRMEQLLQVGMSVECYLRADSKVTQLHCTVGVDQNVGRLNICV